jgi:hypothetical protein
MLAQAPAGQGRPEAPEHQAAVDRDAVAVAVAGQEAGAPAIKPRAE